MCFKGIRVWVLNSISCWSKALLDLDLHKNDCLLQFMTRFLRKVLFFLHGKLNSSPNKTKFTCLSFWSMFCPINALIFFLKITRESVRTFKSNKTHFICICFETFFGDLLNFQILIYQKIAHTNDNEQKEDQIVILIFFLKTDRYVSKSLLISIGFWSII